MEKGRREARGARRGPVVNRHLPRAVEKLLEDRRDLVLLGRVLVAARVAHLVQRAPLRKLVAERDPILLDEHLKAGERAVVRVQNELGQGTQLRRPVPSAERRKSITQTRAMTRAGRHTRAGHHPSEQ
jgi:hypothetical protein